MKTSCVIQKKELLIARLLRTRCKINYAAVFFVVKRFLLFIVMMMVRKYISEFPVTIS
jgi:hypothetical protein